ncbi:thiol reductant ABC exporter subunit CydD [Sphingomonas sp. CARO-RG-8B-R24-01]|uniref:thiol reductant ABC exporter subunit CydD n=1 Tax=Sphingomonas sp. CARO-RG-8B-R24-01 TaxID=2914831 RepID=UPI001F5903B1|nr:thiol reductant ABC exporter subunit CydD [Sphingomonas sp. CARO-RG-8B-R24-01]
MTSAALPGHQPRPVLSDLARHASRLPVLLLLIDSGGAVVFAGGIAGAVSTVAAGSAPVAGWIGLMLLGGAIRGAGTWASARVAARDAQCAKQDVRERVVAALFRPLAGNGTTGAAMTGAVDEVEAIDGYVARFLPARRAARIAPLIVGAAIGIASPISAAILLLTLLPFIATMALAGGAAAAESRRQFEALARLSIRFADRVRALPVILAFGAVERETHGIAAASDAVAARTMRVLRVAFVSSAALEFFAALSVALVAVYAGFNLLGLLPVNVPEHLTLGRAFFVLALAPEVYAPMRRLAAAYHDRQAAETAAERIAGLVAAQAPRPPAWIRAGDGPPRLTFDRVTIRYPGTDHAALENLTLDIAPGEIIALTGPSGSGKSSLLHLLLGLAPLSAGRVEIDGQTLPPDASLAAMAAWSGQAPLLLPGTIADNIALSDPGAHPDAIAQVAAMTGLMPVLGRRRGGLHAQLDARGSGLSGGERRRIGLARAMLKRGPLLLLDEPTAHLDRGAETAMIATIRHACRGRTVLIATHSPALAAIAGRVIALDCR